MKRIQKPGPGCGVIVLVGVGSAGWRWWKSRWAYWWIWYVSWGVHLLQEAACPEENQNNPTITRARAHINTNKKTMNVVWCKNNRWCHVLYGVDLFWESQLWLAIQERNSAQNGHKNKSCETIMHAHVANTLAAVSTDSTPFKMPPSYEQALCMKGTQHLPMACKKAKTTVNHVERMTSTGQVAKELPLQFQSCCPLPALFWAWWS